jgi:hypothetical protein
MRQSLASLKEASLGDVEVKRVIDPIEYFQLQLKEEVDAWRSVFPDEQMVKVIFPLALHQFMVESDRIT